MDIDRDAAYYKIQYFNGGQNVQRSYSYNTCEFTIHHMQFGFKFTWNISLAIPNNMIRSNSIFLTLKMFNFIETICYTHVSNSKKKLMS